MKNYFDKILFETFGVSDKTTSLEMVESWISAQCSPEILEKIHSEFGSKSVQIFKNLLIHSPGIINRQSANPVILGGLFPNGKYVGM